MLKDLKERDYVKLLILGRLTLRCDDVLQRAVFVGEFAVAEMRFDFGIHARVVAGDFDEC